MAKEQAFEFNFDGIVGPTHNYAGLSHGNLASTAHQALESNPREAALQGLEKMRVLSSEGFFQGVLPPQERPDIEMLRRLGFLGSEKKILGSAAQVDPRLLVAVTSASSMWTANAATVSPSADTLDRKLHFTPANLMSKFHRSTEAPTTARILQKIFRDPKFFVHHEALPSVPAFGDEGAANHTRLCADYAGPGVELFVYGRHGFHENGPLPKLFPARQTFEASSAIARNHRLQPDAIILAQQNPDAIDAGIFHNDVAAVGNQGVYFFHEQAYLQTERVTSELQEKFRRICRQDLRLIRVPKAQVSLEAAVKSYLFNSQLLSRPDGSMVLIAPTECQTVPAVVQYLTDLLHDRTQPIREIRYFNLRQSMRNGGGPACLRLRVVLREREIKAMNPKVRMTPKLHSRLAIWIEKHYRQRLRLEDLADPKLLKESRVALAELTQILGLGSVYPFQKGALL